MHSTASAAGSSSRNVLPLRLCLIMVSWCTSDLNFKYLNYVVQCVLRVLTYNSWHQGTVTGSACTHSVVGVHVNAACRINWRVSVNLKLCARSVCGSRRGREHHFSSVDFSRLSAGPTGSNLVRSSSTEVSMWHGVKLRQDESE